MTNGFQCNRRAENDIEKNKGTTTLLDRAKSLAPHTSKAAREEKCLQQKPEKKMLVIN